MFQTLRKKQNSELRLLESVPIWMVLMETDREKENKRRTSIPAVRWKQFVGVSLRPPGAERAAVGADVVERGLRRVGLLFPLPLVDDELPLEVGQELQVLLLLGHAHHLQKKDENK